MRGTGIIWSVRIVTAVDIWLRWIICLWASHRACHHNASRPRRPLPYVCRGQLSPLVTHGWRSSSSMRIIAPGLLAVETGSDAVRTTNHLSSWSQQVLSWVIQETVVDVGTTTADHCCGILRHHWSSSRSWRLELSTGANEAVLREEVIWTCCCLLRKNSRVVSLTGKGSTTECWGAQAILGVLIVDHRWITGHLFSIHWHTKLLLHQVRLAMSGHHLRIHMLRLKIQTLGDLLIRTEELSAPGWANWSAWDIDTYWMRLLSHLSRRMPDQELRY